MFTEEYSIQFYFYSKE
uniref:Uncharacterized protein n=1 Tax=Anguilla anguilla TaxID=7936 RepID=A0A0E9S833_ANGAN